MAGVKWHFVKLKVYLTLSARPQIQKRPRPSQGKGGSLECSTEFLLPSALSNLPTLRRHLRPGRLRGEKDPRKTSHIRQRRVGILRQFSRRSLPCLKQSIGPNIEIRRPSTHPVNPTPMLVAQEEVTREGRVARVLDGVPIAKRPLESADVTTPPSAWASAREKRSAQNFTHPAATRRHS